jgi:ADP-ribose pyrophosphatase YjhB (NUDIX family)
MSTSPSRERVSALLARLRDTHGQFDIQQTTVGVRSEKYDQAIRSSGGVADVRVRCVDPQGRVLLVRDGEDWAEPTGRVGAHQDVHDAAARIVREAAGVACVVEGLEQAAIVCVNDEDDTDRHPFYRLTAHFLARPVEGAPREGDARWAEAAPELEPLVR